MNHAALLFLCSMPERCSGLGSLCRATTGIFSAKNMCYTDLLTQKKDIKRQKEKLEKLKEVEEKELAKNEANNAFVWSESMRIATERFDDIDNRMWILGL
ncbi:hypothetical protein IW261DRAFT_1611413 [Armillaria novae-zelandiae]|uniref:Uncharacterized protein n=1 Tax=Armillaria novae-zelandiae TaxID=153914 RepID=A0AA39NVN2_9AGAR|nr:hypothetical protein IW261DRAFT_1611413 [Armillaria novae-zelandiae]